MLLYIIAAFWLLYKVVFNE